jgi:hypothetical protein
MRAVLVLAILGFSTAASAQRWQDATAQCLGTTAQWTSKVEVADVDGDGHVDILMANGGDYSTAGPQANSPPNNEPTRVWKNLGNWTPTGPNCTEISAQAVGGFVGMSRMIKTADIDGDGDLDIFTGGAYQTQAKLFRRDAAGWTDVTTMQLPQVMTSIGDAEFGDVDDDGDLDLVFVDWGAGNALTNTGGPTHLYRNDGNGTFVDATTTDMPDVLVRMSWDMELADLDGDFDLDVLISSKKSPSSFMFRNDGTGHFTNEPEALPHFTNNYEFEPMDIDGDGDLDVLTINDGLAGNGTPNFTEHVFVNKGDGTFVDETAARLTGAANPAGSDDNTMVWLDVDNDDDADVVIGTLDGTTTRDRLLLNDGTGKFTLAPDAATPKDTSGTLGVAIADLDEDGRLDLVQGQGEVADADKVQLGGAMVALDTQPPVIRVQAEPFHNIVRAFIHDRVAPSHPHDFKSVVVKIGNDVIPMKWYGPMMWRAELPLEPSTTEYQVCATDRAGNEKCEGPASTAGDAGVDAPPGTTPGDDDGGCCSSSRDARGSFVLALLTLAGIRRRRAR